MILSSLNYKTRIWPWEQPVGGVLAQCNFNFDDRSISDMQSAMPSCPLKLSVSRLPISSMPRTLVQPTLGYTTDHAKYATFSAFLVKSTSPLNGLFCSFISPYPLSVMHNSGEIPRALKPRKEQVEPDFPETLDLADDNSTLRSFDFGKEIQRRRKIGSANKGKVPWNKGRKHSEETRERIRLRTKEALKDPKVRKKMSECPRTISNQTKARIRASLTKLWGKRLQWKRSRERFLQSWAEAIAKAAKKGSNDQQEFDWDSYDKIKREITLQQKQEAAEIAKEKETARLKAEKAAQIKAEKMERLAEKRRRQEVNAKLKGESIKKRNKRSKEEIKKLAEFQEVKLKERLLKIHRKKSAINQVSNQLQRPWENFDVDFVKGEQLQKDISLADQIRSAKNRRAEQLLDKL